MTGDDDDNEQLNEEFADDIAITQQPTVDAGNPRTVLKRERKIDREKREARLFWSGILADPIGRRELYRLLQSCKAFEQTFACGPNGFPQPEATWFHAGAHDFGSRFFQSLCVMDREGAFLMLDEHDPRFTRPTPSGKSS